MSVLRLYPAPPQRCGLNGLYLGLNLHRQAAAGDVLLYSNFIASVDGRIALPDPASGEFVVPAAIANRRDWRLYQELAAQADVLLVSGRYFRQLAKGCAQEMLPLADELQYADLHDWRRQQQLAPQPDLFVLSESLDIPQQALALFAGRRVVVLTGSQADAGRRQGLERAGVEIIASESDRLDGALVRQALIGDGYRSAYAIAGPQLHCTLIAARILNRLFLTTHFSLLAGDAFHTLLQGDIHDPVRLELESIYLDQHLPTAQLFASYTLQSG